VGIEALGGASAGAAGKYHVRVADGQFETMSVVAVAIADAAEADLGAVGEDL
jgi:hypothetical protein